MFLHFFFSSKVTFRRIKMQKTKIIRLLSILHEIACFLPFLTRLFMINKILQIGISYWIYNLILVGIKQKVNYESDKPPLMI